MNNKRESLSCPQKNESEGELFQGSISKLLFKAEAYP